MTDEDASRSVVLHAWLRESRRYAERDESIVANFAMPSLDALAQGAPFAGGSVLRDAQTFVSECLLGRVPERVRARLVPLQRALHGEDGESVLACVTAVQQAASRMARQTGGLEAITTFRIACRCDFYLCALDDKNDGARLRCAQFAFGLLYEQSACSAIFARTLEFALRCLRPRSGYPEIDDIAEALTWRADALKLEPLPGSGTKASVSDTEADAEHLDDVATDRAGIVKRVEPVEMTLEQIEDFAQATSSWRSRPTPRPRLLVVPASSVDHLPKGVRPPDARTEIAPIRDQKLPLVTCDDPAAAAAELREEFTWAVDVIDVILRKLVGQDYVRLTPTLLVGTPGCGKTRLMRRIGEVLGVHVTLYSAAGNADGAFGGTSRQWSTSRFCVPLQAILRSRIANPLIGIDELEKSGTSQHNGRLVDSLVPLLELETSKRFHDPYLEAPVDLSAVSFIATANSLDGIPSALLDRLQTLRMPEPGPEHLGDIAKRIVDRIREERGIDGGAVWIPDLAPDELDLLAAHWNGGSLRPLRRFVQAIVDGRDALASRH